MWKRDRVVLWCRHCLDCESASACLGERTIGKQIASHSISSEFACQPGTHQNHEMQISTLYWCTGYRYSQHDQLACPRRCLRPASSNEPFGGCLASLIRHAHAKFRRRSASRSSLAHDCCAPLCVVAFLLSRSPALHAAPTRLNPVAYKTVRCRDLLRHETTFVELG